MQCKGQKWPYIYRKENDRNNYEALDTGFFKLLFNSTMRI